MSQLTAPPAAHGDSSDEGDAPFHPLLGWMRQLGLYGTQWAGTLQYILHGKKPASIMAMAPERADNAAALWLVLAEQHPQAVTPPCLALAEQHPQPTGVGYVLPSHTRYVLPSHTRYVLPSHTGMRLIGTSSIFD